MTQELCNGFMTLWKPLKTSHHPANFGDHKLCDSGDVMVLVCNAFLKNYATKVYVTLFIIRFILMTMDPVVVEI